MFTLIIIIIILYFIFKSDEPNAQNTSSQSKYNDSNTYKNAFSQTLQSQKDSKQVDSKISNGVDWVNGDLVTTSSGKTFRIIEKKENGTFKGINIKTNEKVSLYLSRRDGYSLINGIYVHKKAVSHLQHANQLNVTCPSCQKRAASNAEVCSSCGWKLTTPYVYRKVRLAGVTYENRQSLIERMSIYDSLSIKRDLNNRYDPNAIGIYNSQNQSIGWVPKDIAASLAPVMDSGTKLKVKILKKLGGGGYNFGLEVMISNDVEKLKETPVVDVTPTLTHRTSSYRASSNDYEEEDYTPTYRTYEYNEWDYDDCESNRDYDDYDEEAQGWQDLWEYNQNH